MILYILALKNIRFYRDEFCNRKILENIKFVRNN